MSFRGSAGAVCVTAAALSFWVSETTAQSLEEARPDAELADEKPSSRDRSLLAMPIPISDPAIGNGLAIGAGVLYRAGGSKRPWVTGGGAFYTDNGSKGAAVFQKAFLAQDRFRLTAGTGVGSVNVDFYGIGPAAGERGVSIPINQKAGFVGAQGLMQVAPHLYAGLQYRFIDMKTTIQAEIAPFPDLDIPPAELNTMSSALGLAGEYDTRDNEYQPTLGVYITGVWLVADEAWGSDRNYSRAEFRVNGYRRLNDKTIFAWRASSCWAGDDAPFYDICNYGSQSDLRGYVSGQYRDRALAAAQVEVRRRLFGRFGMVAFAGVGGVGSNFGDITDELLPSAGVGLRYEASRKYGVNIGIDYAVGDESSAFYFRIGEAF